MLLHIWAFLNLNICLETVYTDLMFDGFPWSLQTAPGLLPQITL